MANQFCANTGHRGWRKISLSCDVAKVRKTSVALIGQSVRNFMRPNNPDSTVIWSVDLRRSSSNSKRSARLVRLLLDRTIEIKIFTSLQPRESEVVFSEKAVEPA